MRMVALFCLTQNRFYYQHVGWRRSHFLVFVNCQLKLIRQLRHWNTMSQFKIWILHRATLNKQREILCHHNGKPCSDLCIKEQWERVYSGDQSWQKKDKKNERNTQNSPKMSIFGEQPNQPSPTQGVTSFMCDSLNNYYGTSVIHSV